MRYCAHQSIKTTGTTLLEMMIAIAMSMVMIVGLQNIYITLQRNVSIQNELQHHEDRARQMKNILQGEIEKAGYIGCARLSSEFQVFSPLSYNINVENYLIIKPDQLTVRYQAFPGVVLVENMRQSSRLITSSHERYHAGQVLLISDCEHAEIFRVGWSIVVNGKQKISPAQPLYYSYKQYAEIGEFVIHHYYINQSTCNDNCVFMQRDLDTEAELVPGIKNLSLSQDAAGVYFGFQTTGMTSLNWFGYATTMRMR